MFKLIDKKKTAAQIRQSKICFTRDENILIIYVIWTTKSVILDGFLIVLLFNAAARIIEEIHLSHSSRVVVTRWTLTMLRRCNLKGGSVMKIISRT